MPIGPRIGRWEVDEAGRVVLLGSRCTSCGETLFPERVVCSRCGRRTMEEARITGTATLISHTVVHQVPAGFSGPLVVGYGSLPGEVSVLAPIDAPGNEIRHGMPLELHEGITSLDESGAEFRTYRYRPLSDTGARTGAGTGSQNA